ncbi:MAG: TonB-dependent receptor, partial [Sphingobacteriaceae bacterium]
SNGVIIVTTKLGKAGKTDVSFNYEYGIQQVGRKIKMMDAQQWIRYYVTAKNNAWTDLGGTRSAADPNSVRPALYQIPDEFINSPQQFGKGTNWQDVMFRVAPMQTGQLSVSGGTEKTQYLFSASYLDQTAILDANYYKRIAFRSNIKQAISSKFSVGLNLSFTGIQDRTDGTQGKSDVISLALQSDPIFSVYNSNGTLGIVDPNAKEYRYLQYNPVNLWHPYATTRYTDKKNRAYNALAIGYAEYKILNNLKFRTSINGNLGTNFGDYFLVGNQGYGFNQNLTPSTATASSGSTFNWLTENTLYYELKKGDHALNLLAGYTAQKQRDEFQSATATNFPNNLVRTLNAGTVNAGTSTISEWSLVSSLARLNYNYKSRYFLTSTIRRDGSSRFGEN